MNTGDGTRAILVVDDERILADMLASILDRSGYTSTAVYSASEALVALKMRPDLIISDVMMPEMDGVKLAVQVSKLHPEIKILLISGHAGTEEIVKASGLSLDFSSVVTSKPAMRGRLKTGHGEWPKTGFVLPCRSGFGKADLISR